MPKQLEVYKCDICGNIVEVLDGDADVVDPARFHAGDSSG